MSTKLLAALKKRFRTPAEAIAALGLDASLLDEDDPTRPVIIAHDSADVVWETITNRSPIMSTQEARLMTALRRRFRGGPVEVLRRLGMDQSELAPPDDEPTDAVGELLKQFGALSDADKAEFVEAIGKMASEQDDAQDDAQDEGNARAGVGQYNPTNGRPQAATHGMDARARIGSFAQRYPHAAKIGNGFG